MCSGPHDYQGVPLQEGGSKVFREKGEMCLKLGKHLHKLSIVQGKNVLRGLMSPSKGLETTAERMLSPCHMLPAKEAMPILEVAQILKPDIHLIAVCP